MIILPARTGDGALLYVGPREKNVCFQIQLSGALVDLPAGTHVTDARLLYVQQRWPGQPDEAATEVTSFEFAQLAGVSADVVTVYVGNGTQEEGRLYELAIGLDVNTNPPGLLCAFLRLPCRRAQPWPSAW